MLKCECKNEKIIQHINRVVMEHNYKLIELTGFNISENCVSSLNECLIKHGFNGHIVEHNGSFVYWGDRSDV